MWFAKDLKYGQSQEQIFARYLLDYPDCVSIEFAQWKFKDYDIKLTTKDKTITYEVKADTMAPQTWNFVIETRYKWVPSGIYASKADYIAYCVKDEWYLQSRGELVLRLINTPKRITKWGDKRQSELYVIKCEELDNLFEHLNLNPTNYGQVKKEENVSGGEAWEDAS